MSVQTLQVQSVRMSADTLLCTATTPGKSTLLKSLAGKMQHISTVKVTGTLDML